ncbi:MAG: family 20 glycosylhydrolase, partial [Armatimonadota bacterium]
NTVFMHLTDHNGCAIQIKCYPELATKYAFTHSEMKKLIRYASERHIELIPEIESWGHARWITSVPALSNLAESPDKPGTLCTSNPRTWEVLGNIYREIAGLFPSKYIHAGCDEASFGFCEKCRAEIKADGEDALVGKHLRRVCELVKAAGKIPMIWGDVLLHRRGSVDQVPRETIICHWDYKADLSAEPVKFLKAKGFEVVGCPAIVWGSREILPMADTWDNVSNFARIVLDNRCLGMETTVWVPQRYIADTLYPALAHACEMSWSGPLRSRSEFVAAFARSFLGADPTPDVTEALIRVHDLSIKAYAKIADVGTYARDAFESGKTDSPPMPDVAKAAVSISDCLRRFRPKIKNHLEEYDSLILAADIRAYVEERAGAIEQLAGCLKQAKLLADEGKRSEAASVLQRPIAEIERLAAVDKGLSQRLTAAWDRWRYPDDPKKTEGEDNLTAGFARSGAFLSRTAQRLRSAASLVGKGETFQP